MRKVARQSDCRNQKWHSVPVKQSVCRVEQRLFVCRLCLTHSGQHLGRYVCQRGARGLSVEVKRKDRFEALSERRRAEERYDCSRGGSVEKVIIAGDGREGGDDREVLEAKRWSGNNSEIGKDGRHCGWRRIVPKPEIDELSAHGAATRRRGKIDQQP